MLDVNYITLTMQVKEAAKEVNIDYIISCNPEENNMTVNLLSRDCIIPTMKIHALKFVDRRDEFVLEIISCSPSNTPFIIKQIKIAPNNNVYYLRVDVDASGEMHFLLNDSAK